MPFGIILIGLMVFLVAINGTYKQFGSQLYTDLFTGGVHSFIFWVLAIVIVGMIGYIPGLQKPANAFLALIIVGVVLANKGLFAQFQNALQAGPQTTAGATPLAPVAVVPGGTVAQPANPSQSPLAMASGALSNANALAAGATNGSGLSLLY